MEVMLTTIVTLTVIFFRALISLGNQRQKMAIAKLRDKVTLWAMQNLKVKLNHLAREVRVDDPIDWFNKTVSKVCGYSMSLQVLETFENPWTLICSNIEKGGSKVIITLAAPVEIRRMKRVKQNRLARIVNHNPLLRIPCSLKAFECSTLNQGVMFDLELSLV